MTTHNDLLTFEEAIEMSARRSTRVELIGHPLTIGGSSSNWFCICVTAEGCPCDGPLIRLPDGIAIEPTGERSADGRPTYRAQVASGDYLVGLKPFRTTAAAAMRADEVDANGLDASAFSEWSIGGSGPRPDSAALERLHSLTIADHTAAVKAILDNSLEIFRAAEGANLIRTVRRQGVDLRDLVHRCPSIDQSVREIIDVASISAQAANPADVDHNDLRVAVALAADVAVQPDMPSIERLLVQSLRSDEVASVPGMARGIDQTIELLQDGAAEIYSPAYHETIIAYSKKKSAADNAVDLAKADTAGAILGSVAPGAGTVGGAITASTGAAVVKVVDTVWDWITG